MRGESPHSEGLRRKSHFDLLLGVLMVALLWGCGMSVSAASATVPSTAIRYTYTQDSQLSSVVKPEAEYALYTWDAAGNLSSIAKKSSTKLSIVQLEPSKGAVGETVDVWGTGFSSTPSNDTVKFHGTAATVSAASAYELAVKVPTSATTGTVTVQTTTEGPVTSSQTFTVTSAVGAPTITTLSTSVAAVGTVVTVTGTNFETHTGNDDVLLNQTMAEVTSATSTSLKFVVPGAAASGRVVVSTPYGQAVGPYLYVPPPEYTTTQVGPTVNLTLSGATSLTVASAKTVGIATVEAAGGEMLSTVLKNITISSGTAYLYSPHDEEIGQASFSSGEEKLFEPVTLPTTGTYVILIVPNGENTGKVELTPYYADIVTGTLSPSAEGSSQSASLLAPGQKAQYTVSGTAGEEVSVKVSEFTTFTKPVELEWVTATNEFVGRQRFSKNEFMEAVKLPTTGTYYLIVNPGGINTGSLRVTAYNATAVTGSITPTSGGESKTVTTAVPGQRANITFSGSTGEKVSFVFSESTIKNGSVEILTPTGLNVSGRVSVSVRPR
jgi:hypothetical protein